MSFAKCLVILLSFALSINALATPHIARSYHHRGLSARLAPAVGAPSLSRRRESNRCKPRPSVSPTVVNVAPDPATIKPTIATAAEPKHTSPTPPPPPPPTTSKAEPHNTQAPPPSLPKPTIIHSGGNLPSFMVGTQAGQGTFYATGLGACGITNNDGDYIAAASHLLFDAFPGYAGGDPNSNPICGRKVHVTRMLKDQGKSVTVAITDRCEACALTDLDLSPTAFNHLDDPSVGRFAMEWFWL
ncbi:hypothetical protein AX17_000443 [Amanita inopinata Kibby_2008]|nr:hypothetical protein AX17_000443 [Amanita inopinata Kibby_2008]